jgi:hypothetical protein
LLIRRLPQHGASKTSGLDGLRVAAWVPQARLLHATNPVDVHEVLLYL